MSNLFLLQNNILCLVFFTYSYFLLRRELQPGLLDLHHPPGCGLSHPHGSLRPQAEAGRRPPLTSGGRTPPASPVTLLSSLSWRVYLKEEETDRGEYKGRRCCLGDEFIQFLAALAILHQDYLKNKMKSSNSRIK